MMEELEMRNRERSDRSEFMLKWHRTHTVEHRDGKEEWWR